MVLTSDLVIKILLSVLYGGLIGAEREFRHRAAGFRTIIFITLGATLFTIFSIQIGGEVSPARIAAHTVTGVGFLCAGVIMEQGAQVIGLTTAATIWLAAALGIGVGAGEYLLSGVAVTVSMIILWTFPRLEDWIYNFQEGRTYEVVSAIDPETPGHLETLFQETGLRVKNHQLLKAGDEMVCRLEVYGPPEKHAKLMEVLLVDPLVKEFRI